MNTVLRTGVLCFLAVGWLAAGLATSAHGSSDTTSRVSQLFASSFQNERNGDTGRALNNTLEILRLDRKNYVATLRAGWLYYLRANYRDSIALYERAIALAPKAIEPRLGAMLPLMAAKNWSVAEVMGKKVLRADPRNYTVRSRMAFISFMQGDYKAAERRYRAVLSDFPSDTDMMLGLAWTYVRQGRLRAAEELFRTITAVYPEHLKAKEGLQALKKI